MSDVIIAPTIAYSHKPPEATIVNAVSPNPQYKLEIKEKVAAMVPYTTVPNVPRKAQNKRKEDLETITTGEQIIDKKNRAQYAYEQLTQYKNMTYFPDVSIITGKNTNRIIGGTIV